MNNSVAHILPDIQWLISQTSGCAGKIKANHSQTIPNQIQIAGKMVGSISI
jgi:hypothetical protein